MAIPGISNGENFQGSVLNCLRQGLNHKVVKVIADQLFEVDLVSVVRVGLTQSKAVPLVLPFQYQVWSLEVMKSVVHINAEENRLHLSASKCISYRKVIW